MRIVLLALFWPAFAWSQQNLTGSYVFQSPQGPVQLVLQHTPAQVVGTMTGADGSVSQLQGTFDGQRATGTIAVGGGTGWFAAGFTNGGLTLLVAEIDLTTGQPNLDNGWRLDFARSGAAGQPAPGGSGGTALPGGGATGAPPAPAPSARSPVVQEWMQHLRGKKVSYRESYTTNDVGGSGGYSNSWDAFLCSDGTFHYQSRSRVGIDVGGVTGGGSGGDSSRGQWRIVEQGGEAILQYQSQEQVGTEQGEWVPLSYQDGKTFFGKNRVFVTSENTVCR